MAPLFFYIIDFSSFKTIINYIYDGFYLKGEVFYEKVFYYFICINLFYF